MVAAAEDGHGISEAMRRALSRAELRTDQISYINAHGTSTPLGDAAEVHAVKELFGRRDDIAMSSTKSMTGHALGAAGGLESVFTIRAVEAGVLPPTINLDNPDEGFDLNLVPNQAQEAPVRYALNNSFGFGGHNVCLVFKRWDGA